MHVARKVFRIDIEVILSLYLSLVIYIYLSLSVFLSTYVFAVAYTYAIQLHAFRNAHVTIQACVILR